MGHSYTLKNSKSEEARLSAQAKTLYGGAGIFNRLLKNGYKILDVGCGTGVIAEHIASNLGDSQVFGIDIDDEKIKGNTLKYGHKNLKFDVGDCYKIPYPDNYFDAVYCRFLLMHLDEPQKAVKAMARVVKKGGIVLAHEGLHDAIWISPPRPRFTKFIKAWMRKMAALGQDCSVGLRLNALFEKAGLDGINIDIKTHGAIGSCNDFNAYMENWKQHLPSLKSSMKNILTEKTVAEIERELSDFDSSHYYLELTVLASGRK
ncbi:MAG: class I SAM-dependent methyltransferase [Elusimicrobiales bacterium]